MFGLKMKIVTIRRKHITWCSKSAPKVVVELSQPDFIRLSPRLEEALQTTVFLDIFTRTSPQTGEDKSSLFSSATHFLKSSSSVCSSSNKQRWPLNVPSKKFNVSSTFSPGVWK